MASCEKQDRDCGKRSRTGSSAAPIVVAVALFAVVLGVLFYVKNSDVENSKSTPTATAKSHTARADDLKSDVTETSGATVTNTPAETERLDRTEPSAEIPTPVAASTKTGTAAEPTSKPLPVDPTVARLEKLKAQLAAGEFGPALETVGETRDALEQARLLKLIADAEMESGEFDAALTAISRIPIPERRIRARGERAAKKSFAGGSGADFDSLIELIMSETSGPWEEEDGEGGTITEYETGVRVDPNGMLYRLTQEDLTGRLKSLGLEARKADLNDDMARSSALRLVSVTRLEQEVSKRLADGQPVLGSMKHLAGLSQIQYIFVYPEEREIVIGGPAEGWQYNDMGLPVGSENGRPTLQLDDFVTVLRTFGEQGDGYFNCLIVPRKKGLKELKDYVTKSNSRGPLSSKAVRSWVKVLQNKLGLQDVQVNGIPLNSRVARVIVEADYRMKLIGIGRLDGGSKIPSFFELLPLNLQKTPPALDALRWWLTMRYDAVMHSPSYNVFEIQGSSVKCQSENELITADGKRIHTGKSEATNRLFAENFTKNYATLAARDLVFADLQNIFDLALVAALMRHENIDGRLQWHGGAFAAGGEYRPDEYEPAKTVMSVTNHRVYKGRDIVVQVAGGVRADLMSVIRDSNVFREVARLAKVADRGRAPELPEGRWWWDAAAE